MRCLRALRLAMVAALVVVGGPAFACKGNKVLFDEDFQTADAGWGNVDKNFAINNGSGSIIADSDRFYFTFNTAFLFKDADACATVSLGAQSSEADKSYGGLMFWVVDNRTFHVLVTTSDGYFAVLRMVDDSWVTRPVNWTKTDALKTGPNQPNRIRVRAVGQSLRIEINDTKVAEVRAQAPDRATAIGMFGKSAPKSMDPWVFKDLKVTNIQ